MADSSGMPLNRIFLWVCPRSLSTVVEKAIAHMDGSSVWHEPYTSIYFNRVIANPKAFVKFPKMKTFYEKFEAAAKMVESVKDQYVGMNLETATNFTFEYIKEQLEKPLDAGKKFLLVKDMAFGIDGHHHLLPKVPFRHTFLIRNPNRTALSARKLLAHLYDYKGDLDNFTEIGDGNPFISWDMLSVDPLYNLYKYVKDNIDPDPIIIDADDIQQHPEIILKKYCEAVGIPWKEKYLTWDASDEYLKYFHGAIEQIIWGKNEGVYKLAFESTKILPPSSKPPAKVPSCCEGYAKEFRDGYNIMYEKRIKPE